MNNEKAVPFEMAKTGREIVRDIDILRDAKNHNGIIDYIEKNPAHAELYVGIKINEVQMVVLAMARVISRLQEK